MRLSTEPHFIWRENVDSKKIFFVGVIIAASGLVSPPLALLAGIVFGFSVAHPYRAESHSLAKFLLQASVIGLGFGMNLHEVIHAGRSGFVYTAISITFAIALGLLLGKWMKIAPKASFLITCGTAICGGSAIAALAPITDASEEDMAVSLGTVFTLNAVALLAFPLIGWWLHFTQDQFGLWAALAIHDTSSVVGAAAKYGPQALAVGTTVKLARALWIVPLSFATAMFTKSKAKVQFPWFILLFLLAAVASTYLPSFSSMYMPLNHLGKIGLTVTLFLIGTGLSRETFRQVGVRPMVQGVVLWVVVATLSLLAIRSHLIGI
ncbi:conserved hypothetical integral membrane protein [Terriglobus roseus]|uniref:Conserved hypothetical integral membrane protein n=1 Tax=Terriglobus roseus TaxID=392734 RepID=A0A1H4W484_9BACT|nr:conserved hypothetical integral membrane protein [Terriglobus roseus]